MITALGADPVRRGVLSVGGLEILHAAGFKLRAVPNLHAKTALVDDDWGLAGSGNLTVSGLGARAGGNVELGVVLNPPQVSAAARYFRGWWRSAEPILESDLAYFAAFTPKRGRRMMRLGRAALSTAGRSRSRRVGNSLASRPSARLAALIAPIG
jgi:hypothetical protein